MRSVVVDSSWLLLTASSILILNVLDGVFTLGWIEAGAATEANPLMEHALRAGPVGFMATKVVLVSLGVALLWRLRHTRAAIAGMTAMAVIYTGLCVYHLHALPTMSGPLASAGL